MKRRIAGYDLATPLFAVIDPAAGWNIRLAALRAGSSPGRGRPL